MAATTKRAIPIMTRNPFSYFFLTWLWPLFGRAFKAKELYDSDFGAVNESCSANVRTDRMERTIARNLARSKKHQAAALVRAEKRFAKEAAAAGFAGDQAASLVPVDATDAAAAAADAAATAMSAPPKLVAAATALGTARAARPTSLSFFSLVIAHRLQIVAVALRGTMIGLSIFNTYAMRWFIEWYAKYGMVPPLETSARDGWLWGGIIIGIQVFSSFADAHLTAMTSQLSTRVRSGLIGTLYNKVLRVSGGITGDPYSSAVVQLLFTDSFRLQFVTMFFQFFPTFPIGFFVSLGLLISSSGIYTALAMLGGALVVLPFVGYCAMNIIPAYGAQMAAADARVNRFTEYLSSMSVIKLFGFEPPMSTAIHGLRTTEVGHMGRAMFFRSGLGTLFSVVIVIDIVFMSAVFVYNRPNDPAGLLQAIMLGINCLIQIVFLAPSIAMASESMVSIRRLNHFLSIADRTDGQTGLAEGSKNSIAHEPADVVVALGVDQATFPPPTDLETMVKAVEKRARKKPGKDKKSTATTGETLLDTATSPTGGASPAELVPVEGADDASTDLSTDAFAPAPTKPAQPEQPTERFQITDVRLTAQRGETLGIVGAVGAGKTALLNAMLGEMVGSFDRRIDGSLAFCAQSAWLFAGTVRENILCDNEYDEARYNHVCSICCLLPDFATLIAGDQTTVGEGGVTMSGGQKQRVALARAVYADADVYILDDVVSALDAHVGRSVMTDVIYGELRDKTVVIVTHQTQHLAGADRVLVLGSGAEAGRIVAQGTFAEMHELGHVRTADEQTTNSTNVSDEGADAKAPNTALLAAAQEAANKAGIDADASEELEHGAVPLRFYYRYFVPSGGWRSLLLFVFCIALSASTMPVMQWWVAEFSWRDFAESEKDLRPLGLSVAGAIAFVFVFLTIGTILTNVLIATRASRFIHDSMLKRIFRAPMAWFDVVPSGQVVNRFSKDLSEVDQTVPTMLMQMFNSMASTIATLATMGAVHWSIAVVVVGCALAYTFLLWFTLPYSRQIKRVDSKRRSPVISAFTSATSGVASMRGYGLEKHFRSQAFSATDASAATSFLLYFGQSSQSLMLRVIGCLVQVVIVVVFVGMSDAGKPVIAIQLAQTAFQLAAHLPMSLRGIAEALTQLEQAMSSVERCISYTEGDEVAEEPERHTAAADTLEAAWPTQGAIEFDDVVLRYRPELPIVLDHVSFNVKPGEKVGVVGRSGSGKSTLGQALFRIVDTEAGVVRVDGVETKTLGLHDLRHRLAAIPQDPTLFTGTLRYNLDPEGTHEEAELWAALESAQLRDYFKRDEAGLDFELTAGGENLSAGQRQLVCLARALIRGSRILLCDEATASVDAASDRAVQTAIARSFATSTVLTIAHRLDTVATSDRVLVMDNGKVSEFDSPKALLEKGGAFAALCRAAGAACWNNVADLSGAAVPRMQAPDALSPTNSVDDATTV